MEAFLKSGKLGQSSKPAGEKSLSHGEKVNAVFLLILIKF
jgi:hypothetical protein